MPAVKTTYDGSSRMFRDMDISPSDSTGLDSIAFMPDRGLPWWREIGSQDAGQFTVTELDRLVTTKEMLGLAGLDWKVKQVAMSYRFDGKHRKVDRYLANIREDTGALLGVVSPTYKVFQTATAFEFADNLVDSGDAHCETAGGLFGGRRVLLSMELDSIPGVRVQGEKEEGEVRTYLLLINSFDGSTPLIVMVTPVRWVCKNTMRLALGKHRSIYRIRHSGTVEGKLQAAREALGITFEYMAEFKEAADHLVLQKVVDSQVREIMEQLWPRNPEHPDRETTADKAVEAYHASQTLDGIRGTKWGVLNAVAEFVDHELPVKARVYPAADIRTWGILDGRQAQIKDQAFAILTGKE